MTCFSIHSSSDVNAKYTQPVIINNVTINDNNSTKFSKFEEDANEIENGAFEVSEEEIIKEKIMVTNSLMSGVFESDESLTSSSEEALLGCATALMNHFVVPNEDCNSTSTKYSLLQYVIEDEGYYSVIFSSNFEQVRITSCSV